MHTPAALVRPVEWFYVGVFLNSGVAGFPVDALRDTFDIGIGKHIVGI